jgi:hypothetical protein
MKKTHRFLELEIVMIISDGFDAASQQGCCTEIKKPCFDSGPMKVNHVIQTWPL